MDEYVLSGLNEFKGFQIQNLELASSEEIKKLTGEKDSDDAEIEGLPEDDVTNFCLWLKDTLQSKVKKV